MRNRLRNMLRWLVIAAAGLAGGQTFSHAQVPIAQAQPAAPNYGTNVLSLLPTYDRASYLAATGSQAPAFDPTLNPKSWYDSTQDCSSTTKTITYNYLQVSANLASVGTFTIPSCVASKVNLTGSVSYPPYVVASSNVMEQPMNTPINANYLSTLAQANALVAEIDDPSLTVSEQQMSFFTYTFPANEPRRFYVLNHAYNVGLMELQRNAKGVGYPGKWIKGVDGSYSWQDAPAAPDGSVNPQPSVSVPVRQLLPNESFTSTLMGAQITRTDVPNPAGPAATGSFTDADRSALQQVLALLKSILKQ